MADKYANFDDLCRNETENKDYKIEIKRVENSQLCIVAPHGGKIEPETTELAKEIAGTLYSYYSFKGVAKTGNSRLHITSSNFDEPSALELVAEHDIVLGIHGAKDKNCPKPILLGGLDTDFKEILAETFDNQGLENLSCGHNYPAKRQLNICNRGRSRKGAQIELSMSFRQSLRRDEALRSKFVEAVQQAISDRCAKSEK